MKITSFLFVLLCFYSSFGQIGNKNRVSKTLSVEKDTLTLENVAISPVNFEIRNQQGEIIPPSNYFIDYTKAQLYFNTEESEPIKVSYFKYPDFLTKTYSPFDKKLIIEKATPNSKRFSLKKEYTKQDFFGDINTYGNITRGITVGNNQGSVLNSGLDLQITGNLSDKLKIRASIKDSNLPIQENGVSQNIKEFDRVFIELFTKKWNLKAGDVNLENKDSYFLNFNKKINGAKLDVVLENDDQKTTITASGALAKGRFSIQNISTQEGNQGPYKLLGENGEQNIIVISGSETVYVNGIALKRGDQNDYIIDYNSSQITFNPTFPINASQRIIVYFQYNDQNYNRFVTHDGVKYETDKFSIGAYFYNENDIKSQPIQQNLSTEQKQTLQQAGNNPSKMIAESAQPASYNKNRIQYIKNTDGYFEFSTDKTATLYNVIFSFVGTNRGSYNLQETTGTGNIYNYEGKNKGDYEPITQLYAPVSKQVATFNTKYKINQNSFLDAEVAYSNNDENLFSPLNDTQNKGLATTLTWQQQIDNKSWQSNNLLKADFIHKNFNTVQRLYNPEFNRDWNIDGNTNPNIIGNQTYLRDIFVLKKEEAQNLTINNAYLQLGNDFQGFKSEVTTSNQVDKFNIKTNTSYLKSKSIIDDGSFTRHQSSINYSLKKIWLNGVIHYENKNKKNRNTQLLSNNNQKYLSPKIQLGIGDSTKVYSKFGYGITQIDSVKINTLTRVQNAQNFFLENQWIQTQKTSLYTFANYRKINNLYTNNLDVINARLLYNQQLFNDIIRLSTVYETSSGNTAQQNYTYIETEPGQGYYTYLGDLNNDGVKNFDEFEVAQFTDQANYLRVLLPSVSRVPTQKAKLSQSVFINFSSFNNHASNWLKLLSHFSNQSSVLVNKDERKVGKKININPFQKDDGSLVGLQQSILSSLYFNRGLQNYSTTYTYQHTQNTQNISADFQIAKQELHELNFQHNIQSSWIIGFIANKKNSSNTSSNFSSRNFNLNSYKLKPSLSFLKDVSSTVEANYTYKNEYNQIGTEALISHNFGLQYNYNSLNKGSLTATINLIENKYNGPINTPASYRILEGLQPNRNYTWSLIIQKKLTKLLDLSLTYNGRKNDGSNAIHIGSVQLRANF